MRVALISSTADRLNGYGNITQELMISLSAQGIDCTLFLPKNEQGKHLDFPGKISYVLPPYIFRVRPYNFWGYLCTLPVADFDIVHSLFEFPYCFMAARSAKKYGKPLIIGAQGTYGVLPLTYPLEKHILHWSYAQAQEIIVPSVFTRDQINQYSGKKYPISIIHNGVNFARFQKKVPPVSDSSYVNKKILLTVGGLKKRKGQDLVIKALPQVLQKHPEVVYSIVGSGHWEEYLRSLATELGVSSNVIFAGAQDGDSLISYFQAADVYVHTPRLVHLNFEGFGIVYLEASSCAKPIVATDSGGIRDAVLDKKTGLVVPDGDVTAIAQAIITLLDQPEYRKELGQNGKEYAAAHDWSAIGSQFISVYKKYAK